ncbi:MAG TPA: hybrid sensor histidine kinase/response regulator, partial [Xanthobacteraceae bacterium]
MARLRTKQRRKPLRRRARRRQLALKKSPRKDAGALPVFAHDVRTALTGVLALGELLARSNLGERERHWASDIKTSAEYLAALTTL